MALRRLAYWSGIYLWSIETNSGATELFVGRTSNLDQRIREYKSAGRRNGRIGSAIPRPVIRALAQARTGKMHQLQNLTGEMQDFGRDAEVLLQSWEAFYYVQHRPSLNGQVPSCWAVEKIEAAIEKEDFDLLPYAIRRAVEAAWTLGPKAFQKKDQTRLLELADWTRKEALNAERNLATANAGTSPTRSLVLLEDLGPPLLEMPRLEPPFRTWDEVRAVLDYRAAELVAAADRIAEGDEDAAPRLILEAMQGKG